MLIIRCVIVHMLIIRCVTVHMLIIRCVTVHMLIIPVIIRWFGHQAGRTQIQGHIHHVKMSNCLLYIDSYMKLAVWNKIFSSPHCPYQLLSSWDCFDWDQMGSGPKQSPPVRGTNKPINKKVLIVHVCICTTNKPWSFAIAQMLHCALKPEHKNQVEKLKLLNWFCCSGWPVLTAYTTKAKLYILLFVFHELILNNKGNLFALSWTENSVQEIRGQVSATPGACITGHCHIFTAFSKLKAYSSD